MELSRTVPSLRRKPLGGWLGCAVLPSCAVILVASGCVTGECVPERDGGPPSDAPMGDANVPEGTLTLCEGELACRPIEDGDVLQIVRGCQGSQHVWITLRTEGLGAPGNVIDISLVRAVDEEPVSETYHLLLSLVPDATGESAQLTGFTLIIPSPDASIGDDLVLRASARDRMGRDAWASRRVQLEWGEPQMCGEAGG